MTSVRLPYTVTKRGKLFWQPTPKMQALGFKPKALGPESAESIGEAKRLYEAWQKAQAETRQVTTYPPGTFGGFWDRFRRTQGWARKAPRTREDYERAWKHIDAWAPAPGRPTLSRTVCTSITPDLLEQFYDHLEKTVSANERHRVVKWLKVLVDDMAVRLRFEYASPAAVLKNPQPRGRSAIWFFAEIHAHALKAKELGFEGMSLALRIAWETMFSPVDVWTLRPKQLKRDRTGWYFHRDRTKTLKEVFAAISDELATDLLAYLEAQGRPEADETPLIRQRNGQAYRSKDTFGDDFRTVRKALNPDETRQFMDIRRSANVEADAAGADKKTMGELLANGIAESKFLDETYTPPTVAKAREVAKKRLEGRAKLAGEMMRLRSAN